MTLEKEIHFIDELDAPKFTVDQACFIRALFIDSVLGHCPVQALVDLDQRIKILQARAIKDTSK